jgi:hypothetical protein
MEDLPLEKTPGAKDQWNGTLTDKRAFKLMNEEGPQMWGSPQM